MFAMYMFNLTVCKLVAGFIYPTLNQGFDKKGRAGFIAVKCSYSVTFDIYLLSIKV